MWGNRSRQKRKSHTADTKNTKILAAKNSYKRIRSSRTRGWGVVAASQVSLENPISQQEKTEMRNRVCQSYWLGFLWNGSS